MSSLIFLTLVFCQKGEAIQSARYRPVSPSPATAPSMYKMCTSHTVRISPTVRAHKTNLLGRCTDRDTGKRFGFLSLPFTIHSSHPQPDGF